MGIAVETPARDDVSFRTNDDKSIGAKWLKSDGATPVTVTSATATLEFDPPPTEYDPDTGEPLPPPPTVRHVITSTTPGDEGGWIDAAGLATGVVLVTVPYTVWAAYTERVGQWDLIAVGEGIHRCLVRGRFVVDEGVTP